MSTQKVKSTKPNTKDKSSPKKENKTNKKVDIKKKVLKSKIKKTTQITDLLTYNVKENMMFEDVVEGEVPNQKVPVKYYRIPIYTKNPDGTFGDLICEFGELMCFGISVNTDQKTGEPAGHSMSMSLQERENPTQEQKMRVQKLEEIIERAKEYLVEHRSDVKQHELEMRDLKKFTPIYYKKDAEGKRIDGPPSMYPKLLEQKARIIKQKNEDGEEEEVEQPGKILTVFYEVDDNGEPKLNEKDEPIELDPAKIIDKWCKVKPLIKVESIFVGQSIKLQVKVSEADVKLLQSSSKRLLHTSRNDKASKLLEDKKENKKEEKKENKKEEKKKVQNDEDEDEGINLELDDE